MVFSALDRQTTALVVVDAQVKLLNVMRRRQTIIDNITMLLHLADRFQLPVITTVQYPRMLGPIAPELDEHLPQQEPVEKMEFNCCAVDDFNHRLKATGMKNIIMTGIEAHVCILQTCQSLLEAGYNVHVPQDAVDSRTEENWRVAIELMRGEGAVITSAETAIFQILNKAGTPEFKDMLRMIK